MKKHPCKCEACKTARAERRARFAAAKVRALTAAAQARAAAVEAAHVARVGRTVVEGIRGHLDATWTSQDGRTIPVQGMADSHLFFALAKGYRGEYNTSGWRARLEAEALRRLSKAYFPMAFMPPNPDGSYRDRAALGTY